MSDGVEFTSEIGGDEVKLKLVEENIDIERKCDTEYHIAYTQLIGRGIVPRATLEKRMEEHELWTTKEEKALGELQIDLAKLHIELEAATTHEKGLELATKMGKLRAECLKLVEVKAAVLSNSCESLADQIRRDAYIAYGTVYAETGKKVFADYNDFLARADDKCVADARITMLNIAAQSFSESLTGLPEVNYVKKVEGEIDNATAVASKKKAAKKKAAKKKRVVKKKT